MREGKRFKAWDIEKKRWLTCEEYERIRINPILDKYGNGFCFDDFNNCPYVIWVQYTGLHDKNGEEICEGDILRAYKYNEKWNDGAIGDVTWDEKRAQFRFNWKILLAKSGEKNFRNPISTICSSSAYSSTNREGEIEIIGDIYTTPKLLEDKQ